MRKVRAQVKAYLMPQLAACTERDPQRPGLPAFMVRICFIDSGQQDIESACYKSSFVRDAECGTSQSRIGTCVSSVT